MKKLQEERVKFTAVYRTNKKRITAEKERKKMTKKNKYRLNELQLLQIQRGLVQSGEAIPFVCNEPDIMKLREDVYNR